MDQRYKGGKLFDRSPLPPLFKPLIFSGFCFLGYFTTFVQMLSNVIRSQLQNIIRGARFQGSADRCSTIRDILVESFGTSSTLKGEFESRSIIKERQIEFLK